MMRILAALSLALAAAAATAAAQSTYGADREFEIDRYTGRPADAAALAGRFGRVLGAATQCGMIDRRRIDAATDKAKALIRARERIDEDEMAVEDRFNDAAADGRNAVLDGDIECSVVDADLRGVEALATR